MNERERNDLSDENEPVENMRERLRSDDTANEPVSEDALIDADAIGTGLRAQDAQNAQKS
jgi:hypothetical protein